jgi:hypothetical protein
VRGEGAGGQEGRGGVPILDTSVLTSITVLAMDAHIDLTAHPETASFAIDGSQDSSLAEERDLAQHVLHREVGKETVDPLRHSVLFVHPRTQLADVGLGLRGFQELEGLG